MSIQITTPSRDGGDAEQVGGSTHVPALDGVRGLAILLVLGVHLFASNSQAGGWAFRILGEILSSGFIGVNLFFVLSGFLIGGILLDTIGDAHYFKTFYVRRALRIFPLYYGVLVLLLILTRPLHLGWGGWGPFLFTYTSNLAFWRVDQLIPLHPFNINQFWSLQVEEQFYLVWPFVVYRLRTCAKVAKSALLGCCCVFLIRLLFVLFRSIFKDIYLPYSFTLSCADNLLYGCCLAALLRTSARDRVVRWAPALFAVGSMLTLGMGLRYGGLQWQSNSIVPTVGFTIVAVTWTALITMTLRAKSRTQRAFANPILRFFGRYSYGLYVLHYSIVAMVGLPIRLWMNVHFHSKAFAVFGSAICVLALSTGIAVLSYHLYEVRFLKLKRYFPYPVHTPAKQRMAQG